MTSEVTTFTIQPNLHGISGGDICQKLDKCMWCPVRVIWSFLWAMCVAQGGWGDMQGGLCL